MSMKRTVNQRGSSEGRGNELRSIERGGRGGTSRLHNVAESLETQAGLGREHFQHERGLEGLQGTECVSGRARQRSIPLAIDRLPGQAGDLGCGQ